MEHKFERKACDEKIIEMQTYMVICQAHPEWRAPEIVKHLDEPIYRETAMRLLLALDLSQRLRIECPSYDNEQCRYLASEIMNNIQPELFRNINEWLDDNDLSDIKVHDVSINDVINYYNKRVHFIQALEFMIEWKSTNYANADFYKRYFMHSESWIGREEMA